MKLVLGGAAGCGLGSSLRGIEEECDDDEGEEHDDEGGEMEAGERASLVPSSGGGGLVRGCGLSDMD